MTPDRTPSELCPFCGAADPAVPATGADHFCVVCDQCGCEGPKMATTEGAVVAWDARSSSPNPAVTASRAVGALAEVDRLTLALSKEMQDSLRSIEQMLSVGDVPPGDGTAFGEVQCHCSDDDGVPDIGVSVGLGGGKLLWLGELRLNEGGDLGLVFLGPNDQRIVAPLWPHCEWQDAADILRRQLGPALIAERDRSPDTTAPAIAMAALEEIAAINPADLQEDNALALCHAFLKARAAALAAIAEIKGAA